MKKKNKKGTVKNKQIKSNGKSVKLKSKSHSKKSVSKQNQTHNIHHNAKKEANKQILILSISIILIMALFLLMLNMDQFAGKAIEGITLSGCSEGYACFTYVGEAFTGVDLTANQSFTINVSMNLSEGQNFSLIHINLTYYPSELELISYSSLLTCEDESLCGTVFTNDTSNGKINYYYLNLNITHLEKAGTGLVDIFSLEFNNTGDSSALSFNTVEVIAADSVGTEVANLGQVAILNTVVREEADTTIIASCGEIINSPGTYTLDSNLTGCTGNGINITSDGVVLDCAGYSINGESDNTGIYLYIVENVTVKNCNLNNFDTGVKLLSCTGLNFTGNSAYNNNYAGFTIMHTSNFNYFTNNLAYNNSGDGFYFVDTVHNNTLMNNLAFNNSDSGFMVGGDGYNNFINNSVYDNSGGFQISHNSNFNYFTNNSVYNNGYNLVSSDSFDNVFTSNHFCGGTNYDLYSYNSSFTGEYNSFNYSKTSFGDSTYTLTHNQSCSVTDESISITIIDSCGYVISSPGEYSLEGDLVACNQTGISINSNNVGLDCSGYSLSGNYSGDLDSSSPSNAGIIYYMKDNVSISNCGIYNFTIGILASNSNNLSFNDLSLISNGMGAWIQESNVTTFNGASADNNSIGAVLNLVEGGVFSNNSFYGNTYDLQSNSSYFGGSDNCFDNVTIVEGSWPELDVNYETCSSGSEVESGTTTITSCDSFIDTPGTYTLDSNLTSCTGNGIEITSDDVSLDCQNHTISGDGDSLGIFVRGVENITVENCYVNNFTVGFSIDSINSNFVNNSAYNNSNYGFYFTYSYDNNISENFAYNNFYNLYFNEYSNNNIINYNYFCNSTKYDLYSEYNYFSGTGNYFDVTSISEHTLTNNQSCITATDDSDWTTCTDIDGDGYSSCTGGSGDCDDNNDSVFNSTSLYYDSDGDGYYNLTSVTMCIGATIPENHSSTIGTDCNESDSSIYQSITLYNDTDGDRYNSSTGTTMCVGATIPDGYTETQGTDCDDTNSSIYTSQTLYADSDGDGFYSKTSTSVCTNGTTPSGYSTSQGTDCDDTNSAINTNATESCSDDVDNDCNGYSDCSDSYCSAESACVSLSTQPTDNSTGDGVDTGADTSTSSSGGGGRSASCQEDWICGSWSYCNASLLKSRTCYDNSSCGTESDMPNVTQSCDACEESWICKSWSECSSSDTQTRACYDEHGCSTYTYKPDTSKSCDEEVVDDSSYVTTEDSSSSSSSSSSSDVDTSAEQDNQDTYAEPPVAETVEPEIQELTSTSSSYYQYWEEFKSFIIVIPSLLLLVVLIVLILVHRAHDKKPAVNHDQLDSYIKSEMKAGLSRDIIEKNLKVSGWNDHEIYEGFSRFNNSKNPPTN